MLEIENAHFSYGKHRVLDGASLSVRAGEMLAVLGVNGAGKSTLVKIASGYEKPQSGSVKLCGKDIGQYSPSRLAKRRAVLEQETNLEFDCTVLEAVALGRFCMSGFWGCDETSLKLSREALEKVGLGGFEDKMYLSLSGGERRRVQLARTVAQILEDPSEKLLLLDEPTANLDPRGSLETMALCAEMCRRNAACVAVVHSVDLAFAYADKTAMLKDGKIFKFGKTADVLTAENISQLYGVDCRLFGSNPACAALSLSRAGKKGR